MYRPLIYTCCYGGQQYFDCLALMLKSLYVFGRYRGGILVVTDRPEAQVAVPDDMTDMVHILCCDPIGMSTRFRVHKFIGACDSPLLYIDSDIIITQEIDPVLRVMYAKSGMYVCRDITLIPKFANVPASAITDENANWWGLNLFLDDVALRDRPLLGLNSGHFAFSSRHLFERSGRQIHDMYTSERWSSLASRFTDQPFFNYVLAKSGPPIDPGLLSQVALVDSAETATQMRRLFVHFSWTRDKPQEMSKYVDFLECSIG